MKSAYAWARLVYCAFIIALFTKADLLDDRDIFGEGKR